MMQSWALQESIWLLKVIDLFMASDKLPIISWRVIASQHSMLMSGFAGHIDSWFAIACHEKIDHLNIDDIARHEKIDNLEKPNGYNSCDAQLWKRGSPINTQPRRVRDVSAETQFGRVFITRLNRLVYV